MNGYIKMLDFDLLLQIWGGTGYLLAKLLLAIAEGVDNGRKWRIVGWFSYLLGIPAWVILLVSKNNWVIAANDIGCIPSMILGIITAWKQNHQANKIYEKFVKFFTVFMIIMGTSYSIYYFRGITTISQVLEILVIIGFLSGSYLLAKNNHNGWLLFALMCVSIVILMAIQGKTLLAIMQAISIIIVIIGYIRAKKRIKYAHQ
ncbi:MAG: multidrug transporter [Treponema sp.]|nr:multidrug transporter [Treponema sp.]